MPCDFAHVRDGWVPPSKLVTSVVSDAVFAMSTPHDLQELKSPGERGQIPLFQSLSFVMVSDLPRTLLAIRRDDHDTFRRFVDQNDIPFVLPGYFERHGSLLFTALGA